MTTSRPSKYKLSFVSQMLKLLYKIQFTSTYSLSFVVLDSCTILLMFTFWVVSVQCICFFAYFKTLYN